MNRQNIGDWRKKKTLQTIRFIRHPKNNHIYYWIWTILILSFLRIDINVFIAPNDRLVVSDCHNEKNPMYDSSNYTVPTLYTQEENICIYFNSMTDIYDANEIYYWSAHLSILSFSMYPPQVFFYCCFYQKSFNLVEQCRSVKFNSN